MPRTLTLVPYDPSWPARFAAEAARLRRALAEDVAIEHVGSTAVPGLAGKPVLDIGVAAVSEADSWDKRAYSVAKGPFVERVLADLRAHRTPLA